jgi:acyl-ACP thioesterase
LSESFFAIYGGAARDRRVSARLGHRRPHASSTVRTWHLRESDFDVLDHVNNVRYLEAVEDELAARLPKHKVVHAEMEFRGAVERGDVVDLATEVVEESEGEAELLVWLLTDGEVRMSARVATRSTPTATPGIGDS